MPAPPIQLPAPAVLPIFNVPLLNIPNLQGLHNHGAYTQHEATAFGVTTQNPFLSITLQRPRPSPTGQIFYHTEYSDQMEVAANAAPSTHCCKLAERLQDLDLIALPTNFSLTRDQLYKLLPNLRNAIQKLPLDQQSTVVSLTHPSKDPMIFNCLAEFQAVSHRESNQICFQYKQLFGIEEGTGSSEPCFKNLTFHLQVNPFDCKVSIGLQSTKGTTSSTYVFLNSQPIHLNALSQFFHISHRAEKIADPIVALIKRQKPIFQDPEMDDFMKRFDEISPQQLALVRVMNDKKYATFSSADQKIRAECTVIDGL